MITHPFNQLNYFRVDINFALGYEMLCLNCTIDMRLEWHVCTSHIASYWDQSE